MRKHLVISSIAGLVLLTACGSDDTADTTAATESTVAPVDSAAAPETSVAVETSAAAPETTATAVDSTAAGGTAAAGPVNVDLAEWTLTVDKDLTAGTVEFVVNNVGQFPHELAVVKGDSYATLPLSANGAVDEAALEPGALIGRSDRINGGESTTVSFDLEAGDYVLLCNIAVGPNSHAAAGQVLDVTVG
jgi:hypothetical protein